MIGFYSFFLSSERLSLLEAVDSSSQPSNAIYSPKSSSLKRIQPVERQGQKSAVGPDSTIHVLDQIGGIGHL